MAFSFDLGNLFTKPTETGSFDFAGMSKEGIDELCTAINKFADTVEGEISNFNSKADLSGTYAGGAVQAAVTSYLGEAAKVLNEWVSTLRTEADRAKRAYEEWSSGEAGQVSGSISGNSSALRSVAGEISLD